jgi:hypothetical protein
MSASYEIIGSGSMGQVFRKGNFAYKPASITESEIYRLLSGKPGISPGFLEGDKIVTPYYPTVISIDTVEPENRSSFAKVVGPNVARINKAVSYLIATGYEYSDPLQFGLSEDGVMDLLDFSNGNNHFPSDVISSNLADLARFYRQFGLKAIGDAVSITDTVLGLQRSRAAHPYLFDFFGDFFDGVNYRAIHNALNGLPAKYAYYTYQDDIIDALDISQTDTDNGVKVVLSLSPIVESVIDQQGLVLVFAEF